MVFTTDGLVINEAASGENDKLLTLLTPEFGKLRVSGKGVRSIKSKMMAATQLFAYGNYEIYQKGEYYWLREAYLKESFFGIRSDIVKLSLATYICELAGEMSVPQNASVDILRLTLNSLYAISKGDKPLSQIKGVYEIRAAGYSGYMPNLSECSACRKNDFENCYLDIMNGCIICEKCIEKTNKLKPDAPTADEYQTAVIMSFLDRGALEAMKFALTARPERALAFSIDEASLGYFSKACETYILNHLERGFDSLDFYKSIL